MYIRQFGKVGSGDGELNSTACAHSVFQLKDRNFRERPLFLHTLSDMITCTMYMYIHVHCTCESVWVPEIPFL